MGSTYSQDKSLITERDRVFQLTNKQAGFIFSQARYPAYVSAWGTGKTTAAIGRAERLSEEYENNLGVIFRKEYTDLKDSTVKDFELYTGRKVDSGREVKYPNGSIIMFRHLEEMNNLQNINLGWFWIEQAEELDTDEQFFLLFGRLRRKGVPRSGFITANTNGHNWIYKNWKLKQLDGGDLYEANSFENAHLLPADTIESWKALEKVKPKIYRRFVLNSWDDADTVDIMIQPDDILKATKRDLNVIPPLRRVVSIDVARFGDDKTVMCAIENNRLIGVKVTEKKRTTETTAEALLFAKRMGGDDGAIESFAVDEIGVGAGVADELYELKKDVIFVNSSRESKFPEKYVNLRAEIYGTGADTFADGKVELKNAPNELIEQLAWAKYKAKGKGLIQIEPKDDIKKRYNGVSPDYADSFLIGLWALPQIHPERVLRQDKYARAMNKKPAGPVLI